MDYFSKMFCSAWNEKINLTSVKPVHFTARLPEVSLFGSIRSDPSSIALITEVWLAKQLLAPVLAAGCGRTPVRAVSHSLHELCQLLPCIRCNTHYSTVVHIAYTCWFNHSYLQTIFRNLDSFVTPICSPVPVNTHALTCVPLGLFPGIDITNDRSTKTFHAPMLLYKYYFYYFYFICL